MAAKPAPEDERFDAVFLNLAQQITAAKGPGLDPLFDSFFSFLRRRTDFYTGADDAKVLDKVTGHVRKQLSIAKEDAEKLKRAKAAQSPPAAAAAKAPAAPAAVPAKTVSGQDSKVKIEMIDEDSARPAASAAPVAAVTPAFKQPELSKPAEGDDIEEKDKGKLMPNLGNGADFEAYSWTQTLSEVNIVIPVPTGTQTKQVDFAITRNSIRVGLKGKPPVLQGALCADVRPDECQWTLEMSKERGRVLCVRLDKVGDMNWWDKICEGQPVINTRKVQPENSKLSDLDSDTRQTVEKMMFDQRQKAIGKPTSDEQKKLEALEKIKKANPNLDFSNVNLGGSSFGGSSFNM